jgi:ubiquitin carboxyl-terminal hydrolase L5
VTERSQVAHNSCASVALLNVINNAEHIDLGERLQKFKDSTTDLDPFERGVALAEFGFVRAIHNSFAR